MKQLVILLATLTILGSSCSKTCKLQQSTTKATATEVAALKTYLDSKGITANLYNNGFYYVIKNAGTGSSVPTLCDGVTVKYVGKLLDGTVFDSATTPVSFNLNQLILSWQMAIPLIKSGGSITIYAPATLAYGNSSPSPTIPANSAMIFDIDLVSLN